MPPIRVDGLAMVGTFARLLPFVYPSSILICLLLGFAPASTVKVWFGDGRVDLGWPTERN
ncbi:hypothetical protein TIFTF001_040335 [Ficus carica]|uniref:Uncharacterized protein n=1 Tax=Ficus carica TaxID=3494 RepID=A0AA88CIZ6_FICCA|nr:hypothetical protein TIFTF001_040335 [Ficus carica]